MPFTDNCPQTVKNQWPEKTQSLSHTLAQSSLQKDLLSPPSQLNRFINCRNFKTLWNPFTTLQFHNQQSIIKTIKFILVRPWFPLNTFHMIRAEWLRLIHSLKIKIKIKPKSTLEMEAVLVIIIIKACLKVHLEDSTLEWTTMLMAWIWLQIFKTWISQGKSQSLPNSIKDPILINNNRTNVGASVSFQLDNQWEFSEWLHKKIQENIQSIHTFSKTITMPLLTESKKSYLKIHMTLKKSDKSKYFWTFHWMRTWSRSKKRKMLWWIAQTWIKFLIKAPWKKNNLKAQRTKLRRKKQSKDQKKKLNYLKASQASQCQTTIWKRKKIKDQNRFQIQDLVRKWKPMRSQASPQGFFSKVLERRSGTISLEKELCSENDFVYFMHFVNWITKIYLLKLEFPI